MLALLAVSGLAASAAGAGSASAATYNYCGYLLQPDQWCHDGFYKNHDYNEANYYGGGTVRVGVSFQRKSDGAILYRYFGYNTVNSGVVDTGCRTARVANASGNQHTIWGTARYYSHC